MSLVWINGQLVDKSEAKISVFDHGFLYGDGVWTHLRAFGGKLFRPEVCLVSLRVSAELLELAIPMSESELIDAINSAVSANKRSFAYVRVIVSRGLGTIGFDSRKIDPQIIILVEEYQPFPAELYEHGLDVATNPQRLDTRNPINKRWTLNQLPIVQAKNYALQRGCLDAILVDHNNEIVGCTEGAVFAVSGSTFCCSEPWQLDGSFELVTNLLAIEAIDPLPPGAVSHSIVHATDELFLAGVSCGVIGIVKVDGKPIGSGKEGPITRRIREAYRKLTRGEL